MSKEVSIRYLIDVAIGSPDPGVVNFNALYTVLQAMCEKLGLDDKHIEIDSSFRPVVVNDSKSNVSSERLVDHQVYDDQFKEDEDSTNRDTGKTYESVSAPDHQYSEERKVAFDRYKEKSEPILASHGAKKPKTLDIKQHIDSLNERMGKLENIVVLTVDAEQNVECLRHSVNQLQDQIDSLEKSLIELKEKRHAKEEDISACRIKLEYDKISSMTENLQQELRELKESLGKGTPTNAKDFDVGSYQCYSTGEKSRNSILKFETQLIEVKTSVCILTDKLALLDESVMNITNTLDTLKTFQNDISNLKTEIKDAGVATLKAELEAHQVVFDEIKRQIEDVANMKMDKEEIEELLSEKADYTMLQRKVSTENMDAEYRKLDQQINEVSDCVVANEEKIQKQIDDIKSLIGEENLKDMIVDFKLKTDKEVQVIREGLKRLSEIKPDVESAVTRLKDLACLSCDQNVVMRTIKLNNLSKFADAHVSKSMSPSIAFEMGKLREAGRMGSYYQQDKVFQLDNNMRHSGGGHTIITKQDQVSRIKSLKRKL